MSQENKLPELYKIDAWGVLSERYGVNPTGTYDEAYATIQALIDAGTITVEEGVLVGAFAKEVISNHLLFQYSQKIK